RETMAAAVNICFPWTELPVGTGRLSIAGAVVTSAAAVDPGFGAVLNPVSASRCRAEAVDTAAARAITKNATVGSACTRLAVSSAVHVRFAAIVDLVNTVRLRASARLTHSTHAIRREVT